MALNSSMDKPQHITAHVIQCLRLTLSQILCNGTKQLFLDSHCGIAVAFALLDLAGSQSTCISRLTGLPAGLWTWVWISQC
mgnify:CR=1 FL=1